MAVFGRSKPEFDSLLRRGVSEKTFDGRRSATLPEAAFFGLPFGRAGLSQPTCGHQRPPSISASASRAADLEPAWSEGAAADGRRSPLPSRPYSFASAPDVGRCAFLRPERGGKCLERWDPPRLDGLDRAVHAIPRIGGDELKPSYYRGGARSVETSFDDMFPAIHPRGHNEPSLSHPWISNEKGEVGHSLFPNEDLRTEALSNLYGKILHGQNRDVLLGEVADSRSALRRFYGDTLLKDCSKESRSTYVDVMCRENDNPLIRADRLSDICGNIGEDLRRDGALHRHYVDALFRGEMTPSRRRWAPLHERYRSESPQRRPTFDANGAFSSNVGGASRASNRNPARVPGEIFGATMRALEVNDEDRDMQHHRNDVNTSYWDRTMAH